MPASGAGKSAAAQSVLMPSPTTTRGSALPSPSVSPRTPASLRSRPGASMTRSFGHLSRTEPAARPAVASAASAIASDTTAASRQAASGSSQVGRKPSESSSAPPAGATQDRPSRPRPAVCSSATARQTSGVASASQPRTTSLVEPTRSNRSRRARNVIRRPRLRCRPLRVVRARRRRGAPGEPSRGRPRRSCR